jgi:hypothetical protein
MSMEFRAVRKSSGGYVLSHAETGKVIAGGDRPLTIQSLAVEVQRLHVLGR